MVQRISSWVPVPIKSSALMKNVPSQFDRIIVAWTFEVLIGEKS